jgi:hypothetical protein
LSRIFGCEVVFNTNSLVEAFVAVWTMKSQVSRVQPSVFVHVDLVSEGSLTYIAIEGLKASVDPIMVHEIVFLCKLSLTIIKHAFIILPMLQSLPAFFAEDSYLIIVSFFDFFFLFTHFVFDFLRKRKHIIGGQSLIKGWY